ncbi:molybdate ABC transporter permease subunit [Methanotorris igneus]|uniref:Molybdate ABC transporter, inner membrane subunit n=1 Tax=Methanotorris igneus (strain DSM 5666 / JCM 11834 / Kol 5) TaxID=880724 RepID=F6BAR8_METIK|nr:molybdate ABC transporter permease subunit [Methanotorris igneus]AEF95882.1 molybdate ABC transporter, inner membrane subunit [Methanotorris igneus Kol 5]
MQPITFRFLIGFSITVFILLIIMPFVALLFNILSNPLEELIDYKSILNPLILSVTTSLVSTIISLCVGIPLAYILTYKKFPLKDVFDTIVNLPLVVPPTVAGYLLLITFGRYGLIGYPLHLLGITIMFTTFAIVIAQTFVALPFMVRSIRASLQDIPSSLVDAAKTLGASEYEIFKEIILPLSKTGIISGIILTYARAMGEFGATVMVCGLLETLPIAIFNSAMGGNREIANILSLILIVISFGILTLFKRIAAKG